MMRMKVKNIALVIRVTNIVTALSLVVFCVLSMISDFVSRLTSFQIFLVLSPLYMILFGLCMLAAEFKVKLIMKHLRFLKSLFGRGLFNIYLASVVYYYFAIAGQIVLAWTGSLTLFTSGCFYLVMHCIWGDVLKDNDNKLEEENSGAEETKDDTFRERLV